jgi:hypothetical protein
VSALLDMLDTIDWRVGLAAELALLAAIMTGVL